MPEISTRWKKLQNDKMSERTKLLKEALLRLVTAEEGLSTSALCDRMQEKEQVIFDQVELELGSSGPRIRAALDNLQACGVISSEGGGHGRPRFWHLAKTLGTAS